MLADSKDAKKSKRITKEKEDKNLAKKNDAPNPLDEMLEDGRETLDIFM